MTHLSDTRGRSFHRSVHFGTLLILSIGWLAALPGCSSEVDRPDVIAQKVYMHEERGEYDEAIAAISQLIEREPENAMLYYDRGVFHESLGQLDEARDDYSRAIERAPGHPEALNNRAAVLARQGQLDLAIVDWDAAIEHNPDNELAYRNRGEAYLDLKQPDKALADLDQAQRLNRSDPLVYLLRGKLHSQQQRPYEALEDLTIATFLAPDHQEAQQLRLQVYEQIGVDPPAANDEVLMPVVEELKTAPAP